MDRHLISNRTIWLLTIVLLLANSPVRAVNEPQQLHFVVKKFEILGDNPLSPSETNDVLNGYLGDHYGLEGIQQAIDAFRQKLRDEGFAFYQVILAPQKLEGGVIKLQLVQLKINKLEIQGNRFFSRENLQRNIPTLKPGELPNTRVLSRALAMANAQPSKVLKLQFTESKTTEGIDARLKVDELKPDFAYVAFNNTGNDETGNFRLTAGYQFTNLFDRDHNLSLNYTTSPDNFSAVQQYSGSYTIPFYTTGGEMNFFLMRSDVDSGVVSQNFTVSGAGTIALLHYKQTFLRSGAYKQQLDFGIDHKLFENKVDFLGQPVSGTGDVLSRPVTLAYIGFWQGVAKSFSFSLAPYMNISGGSNNTDSDYNKLRENATADWSLLRYSLGYDQLVRANWLVRMKVLGQQSGDRLISGEQFGIGGIYSVRGFNERALQGDSGLQVNFELWMPSFGSTAIRPLVFFDYGHVEINETINNETPSIDISSSGFGLRWSIVNKLNFVLDVAYVTGGAEEITLPGLPSEATRKGDVKGHIDVFYRF